MASIYPNLVAAVSANNLTFPKLAKAIGMPKTTLYRRISGETEWKLHEVLRICEALCHYDVNHLFLRLDNIS